MQIRLGEILRDEDTWPREQLDPHRVALFCELETRKGTCRLGPALARELAGLAPRLAEAVAPPAEQLARTLLEAPDHPTPLTRRRHSKSITRRRKQVPREG